MKLKNIIGTLLMVVLSATPILQIVRAETPIKVSENNPRWLIYKDKPIYLAGHQNLRIHVNYGFSRNVLSIYDSPGGVDLLFDEMNQRGTNFWRVWYYGSTGRAGAEINKPPAYPLPWARTGPGTALDGLPKFDLTKFNSEYFDRLYTMARKAKDKNIILGVMLFDVYAFVPDTSDRGGSFFDGNPFHPKNNINGVNSDLNNNGYGIDGFFISPTNKILNIQKAYVEKVIDTLNEFDNIIFEITNETTAAPWQTKVINWIRQYEATKPKTHIIWHSIGGLQDDGTFSNSDTFIENSSAEVLSFGRRYKGADFRKSPVLHSFDKPIIMDIDHIWAYANPQPHTLPWKALTRGYHYVIYEGWSEVWGNEGWHTYFNEVDSDRARRNLGQAATYANNALNLEKMIPSTTLSSTGYVLAQEGIEYIIFSEEQAPFSVKGLKPNNTYEYEWYNTYLYSKTHKNNKFIATSNTREFTPPYGNAVLYIRISNIAKPKEPTIIL